MELENLEIEWDNPDTEKQALHVLPFLEFLTPNLQIEVFILE